MEVFNDLNCMHYAERELVVALGNFDGVHLGHQRLLTGMVDYCNRRGKVPSVLLFHPHPQMILNSSNNFKILLDTDRKIEMMAALKIRAAFIVPFDDITAALEAEEFVRSILIKSLKVAGVFVGFNYSFGRGAGGTPALMHEYGKKYGFSVTIMPPVLVNGLPVSSTAVRLALGCGDITRARLLLGYWPTVRGTVVAYEPWDGQAGIPAAYVAVDRDMIVPCCGVYTGSVKVGGCTYTALVNTGFYPAGDNNKKQIVKVHLVDYRGSVCGCHLEIEFHKKSEKGYLESQDVLIQRLYGEARR